MSPPPASDMNSTTASNDKLKSSAFRVGLGDVTPNNLGQLKRLNTVLFPVTYTVSFYKDVLEVGEFAKIIYFNDICVGGVCCRKEQTPGSTSSQDLYIATLGVLAPYRRLGLGSKLLDHILEHAQLPPTAGPKISKVYLHVQKHNKEALDFYEKRGFKAVEEFPNYYPQLEETGALKLEKVLLGDD
ncbi:N-alpha-acetyltransferase 50 [Dissophora globulifera]|nr:N-alpha-acetyltransferase 50 [Dissophora globulifera]